MLTSTQHQGTLTIRFTSGVCYKGVDYGPHHVDRPVTMPAHEARWYLQRGVARVVEDLPSAQADEQQDAGDDSDRSNEQPQQPANKRKRSRR